MKNGTAGMPAGRERPPNGEYEHEGGDIGHRLHEGPDVAEPLAGELDTRLAQDQGVDDPRLYFGASQQHPDSE